MIFTTLSEVGFIECFGCGLAWPDPDQTQYTEAQCHSCYDLEEEYYRAAWEKEQAQVAEELERMGFL